MIKKRFFYYLITTSLTLHLACSEEPKLPRKRRWSPHAGVYGALGNQRHMGQTTYFGPFHQNDSGMAYVDFRFMRDSKRNYEGNFGLGVRYLWSPHTVLGVYGFYDKRHTQLGNNVNQATFGVEALNTTYEGRFNVYLPENKTKTVTTHDTKPRYKGNIKYIISSVTKEVPLKGFDIEVGRVLPAVERVRAFAAYYSFFGRDGAPSVRGVRVRAEIALTDKISLDLQKSYDGTRKGAAFVGLSVRIPFGESKKYEPNSVDGLMTKPAVRDIDIVTSSGKKEQETVIGEGLVHYKATRGRRIGSRGASEKGTYEAPYVLYESETPPAPSTPDGHTFVLLNEKNEPRMESNSARDFIDTGVNQNAFTPDQADYLRGMWGLPPAGTAFTAGSAGMSFGHVPTGSPLRRRPSTSGVFSGTVDGGFVPGEEEASAAPSPAPAATSAPADGPVPEAEHDFIGAGGLFGEDGDDAWEAVPAGPHYGPAPELVAPVVPVPAPIAPPAAAPHHGPAPEAVAPVVPVAPVPVAPPVAPVAAPHHGPAPEPVVPVAAPAPVPLAVPELEPIAVEGDGAAAAAPVVEPEVVPVPAPIAPPAAAPHHGPAPEPVAPVVPVAPVPVVPPAPADVDGAAAPAPEVVPAPEPVVPVAAPAPVPLAVPELEPIAVEGDGAAPPPVIPFVPVSELAPQLYNPLKPIIAGKPRASEGESAPTLVNLAANFASTEGSVLPEFIHEPILPELPFAQGLNVHAAEVSASSSSTRKVRNHNALAGVFMTQDTPAFVVSVPAPISTLLEAPTPPVSPQTLVSPDGNPGDTPIDDNPEGSRPVDVDSDLNPITPLVTPAPTSTHACTPPQSPERPVGLPSSGSSSAFTEPLMVLESELAPQQAGDGRVPSAPEVQPHASQSQTPLQGPTAAVPQNKEKRGERQQDPSLGASSTGPLPKPQHYLDPESPWAHISPDVLSSGGPSIIVGATGAKALPSALEKREKDLRSVFLGTSTPKGLGARRPLLAERNGLGNANVAQHGFGKAQKMLPAGNPAPLHAEGLPRGAKPPSSPGISVAPPAQAETTGGSRPKPVPLRTGNSARGGNLPALPTHGLIEAKAHQTNFGASPHQPGAPLAAPYATGTAQRAIPVTTTTQLPQPPAKPSVDALSKRGKTSPGVSAASVAPTPTVPGRRGPTVGNLERKQGAVTAGNPVVPVTPAAPVTADRAHKPSPQTGPGHLLITPEQLADWSKLLTSAGASPLVPPRGDKGVGEHTKPQTSPGIDLKPSVMNFTPGTAQEAEGWSSEYLIEEVVSNELAEADYEQAYAEKHASEAPSVAALSSVRAGKPSPHGAGVLEQKPAAAVGKGPRRSLKMPEQGVLSSAMDKPDVAARVEGEVAPFGPAPKLQPDFVPQASAATGSMIRTDQVAFKSGDPEPKPHVVEQGQPKPQQPASPHAGDTSVHVLPGLSESQIGRVGRRARDRNRIQELQKQAGRNKFSPRLAQPLHSPKPQQPAVPSSPELTPQKLATAVSNALGRSERVSLRERRGSVVDAVIDDAVARSGHVYPRGEGRRPSVRNSVGPATPSHDSGQESSLTPSSSDDDSTGFFTPKLPPKTPVFYDAHLLPDSDHSPGSHFINTSRAAPGNTMRTLTPGSAAGDTTLGSPDPFMNAIKGDGLVFDLSPAALSPHSSSSSNSSHVSGDGEKDDTVVIDFSHLSVPGASTSAVLEGGHSLANKPEATIHIRPPVLSPGAPRPSGVPSSYGPASSSVVGDRTRNEMLFDSSGAASSDSSGPLAATVDGSFKQSIFIDGSLPMHNGQDTHGPSDLLGQTDYNIPSGTFSGLLGKPADETAGTDGPPSLDAFGEDASGFYGFGSQSDILSPIVHSSPRGHDQVREPRFSGASAASGPSIPGANGSNTLGITGALPDLGEKDRGDGLNIDLSSKQMRSFQGSDYPSTAEYYQLPYGGEDEEPIFEDGLQHLSDLDDSELNNEGSYIGHDDNQTVVSGAYSASSEESRPKAPLLGKKASLRNRSESTPGSSWDSRPKGLLGERGAIFAQSNVADTSVSGASTDSRPKGPLLGQLANLMRDRSTATSTSGSSWDSQPKRFLAERGPVLVQAEVSDISASGASSDSRPKEPLAGRKSALIRARTSGASVSGASTDSKPKGALAGREAVLLQASVADTSASGTSLDSRPKVFSAGLRVSEEPYTRALAASKDRSFSDRSGASSALSSLDSADLNSCGSYSGGDDSDSESSSSQDSRPKPSLVIRVTEGDGGSSSAGSRPKETLISEASKKDVSAPRSVSSSSSEESKPKKKL